MIQAWKKTITILVLFIAVLIISAIYLTPLFWPMGLMIWILFDIFVLLFIVSWHSTSTLYRCPNCSHVFEISAYRDLISPHGFDKNSGWVYLRCPSCQQRVKALIIAK